MYSVATFQNLSCVCVCVTGSRSSLEKSHVEKFDLHRDLDLEKRDLDLLIKDLNLDLENI